jgi:hypothetical protein
MGIFLSIEKSAAWGDGGKCLGSFEASRLRGVRFDSLGIEQQQQQQQQRSSYNKANPRWTQQGGANKCGQELPVSQSVCK